MIARRHLLAGTAALAALAGLPHAAAADARAAALLATIRSPGSARAIGEAYLATHPHEANVTLLVDALDADQATSRCLAAEPCDPIVVAQAVAEAVRADFIARRTVKLDGWVLARTEARLCALHALV